MTFKDGMNWPEAMTGMKIGASPQDTRGKSNLLDFFVKTAPGKARPGHAARPIKGKSTAENRLPVLFRYSL